MTGARLLDCYGEEGANHAMPALITLVQVIRPLYQIAYKSTIILTPHFTLTFKDD